MSAIVTEGGTSILVARAQTNWHEIINNHNDNADFPAILILHSCAHMSYLSSQQALDGLE